ncbi:MAG: hypothetical protein C0402_15470 [Thermodesulfovibrio sp.]|nr:hypothetical protein [Thermodesulfovibrio sp.]
MLRFFAAPALLFLFLFWTLPVPAEGAHSIAGPDVRLVNNDIYISFTFVPDEKTVQEIRDGMDKEFRLHADLFRVWKSWSDEFVLGKFFVRKLKSDPIKKEYLLNSFDGQTIIEKRFRSFESMLTGALVVKDLKLTNTRELEPGQYFVRITVESKTSKLPPLIGHLLIFVQDNEFKIKKDSGIVLIEGSR